MTPTDMLQLMNEPWFTYSAVEFLDEQLKPERKLFEWGMGASTIWFASRVEFLVSVEDDQKWFEAVREKLKALDLIDRCSLNLVRPAAEGDQWLFYASIINNWTGPFDIIVIDGPPASRPLCAKLALEKIAPRGAIILDNSDTEKEPDRILTAGTDIRLSFAGKGADAMGREWETALYFAVGKR